MKTETIKKECTINLYTYICEYCGIKSKNKSFIFHCERKHKQDNCKHINVSYDECDGTIEKICDDCGLGFGFKYLDDCDDATLEKIYNLII